MRHWIYLFMGLLAVVTAPSARATVLISGSGWQSDVVPLPGVPSTKSVWTFTVAQASFLSVVDRAIPGDVYTLTGDVAGVSSFSARSAADVQASGLFGSFWTNILYSKLAVLVAPGAYRFSISGDGKGGSPAGLGLRLDASPVPEPSSWALLISAFGIVGVMLRRRSQRIPEGA